MAVREVKQQQREPDPYDPTSEQQPAERGEETLPRDNVPVTTEENGPRLTLTPTEVNVEYGITMQTQRGIYVKYTESNRFAVPEGMEPEELSGQYKDKVRGLIKRVHQIVDSRVRTMEENGR